MLRDFRIALRFLARRRFFTFVAVLTIAVGVGANTAIFSLADSVLFRPLPYADASRLFVLEPRQLPSGLAFSTLAVPDLQAARDTGLFDAVLDIDPVSTAFVRDGDRLQLLRVQPVPPEYLSALGIGPLYGRDFNNSDTGQRAVLLTYRTWMGRYGGNTAILDSIVPTVDGAPLHIVGVLPPGFRTLSATPFFTPPDLLSLAPATSTAGGRANSPIVRLAAGVSPAAAQARLSALTATELKPGAIELQMVPLRERLARTSGSTLTILLAAALLVLIVGSVNFANLLLARGAERERELAVRVSLGASRWRVARLLLVESAAIAAAGGAAGLAIAYWGYSALVANLPPALARSIDPRFDLRALVFGFATAMIAGLAAAGLPAWRLARADARDGLRLGQLLPRAQRRGRKALLAFEVAIAALAVIAAVMLGRSLADLVTRQLGFDASRLIVSVFPVGPAEAAKPRSTRATEFARLLEAIRSLPDVRAAGAMTTLPASGAMADLPLFPRGGAAGGVWTVSSQFFRALRVPVLEGREFDDRESFDDAPVAVLNQSAVRVLFPGGHAVGRQVSAPGQPTRTIVGVVADWRRSLKYPAMPAMYVPFDRARFRSAQALVDAPDSPLVREQLQATIARLTQDADVSIQPIATLLDRDVAPLRFTLMVIGGFALLTLLLAGLGVYGVMAFLAAERTQEYGLRLALGATPRAVGMLVIRQALVPLTLGLAAGLATAIWTSQILTSRVLDVLPATPATFVVGAVMLFGCGLVAAALPAHRATRIDPMIALRAE